MNRVMEDIRRDMAAASGSGNSSSSSKKKMTANGDIKTNGDAQAAGGSSSKTPSLALPPGVIDEALRVTRESLEMVCEIEE